MKLEINNLLDQSGFIKKEYTCDGVNVSPSMEWSEAPSNTNCFAVYVFDPDAPSGNWIHWIVVNIPENVKRVSKNSKIEGGEEVINDFGKESYGGPCPPTGTHRYVFRVYALSKKLENITKNNFINKVESVKLDEAEVIGKYKRS